MSCVHPFIVMQCVVSECVFAVYDCVQEGELCITQSAF